jgi:signal peptidase I
MSIVRVKLLLYLFKNDTVKKYKPSYGTEGDVVRIIGSSVNARIHDDWTYYAGHIITDKIIFV